MTTTQSMQDLRDAMDMALTDARPYSRWCWHRRKLLLDLPGVIVANDAEDFAA